jgi:hypothetical protein
MTIPGKPTCVHKWIHSDLCVLHVEVEAVIPDFEPREPLLTPPIVRFLDSLQSLANAGQIDELAKHGTVYVRRTA